MPCGVLPISITTFNVHVHCPTYIVLEILRQITIAIIINSRAISTTTDLSVQQHTHQKSPADERKKEKEVDDKF